MEEFELEIRSSVLTARAASPSVTPRWTVQNINSSLERESQGRKKGREGGGDSIKIAAARHGAIPNSTRPSFRVPSPCQQGSGIQLPRTLTSALWLGDLCATQEHPPPVSMLQEGWDPLPHPEEREQDHLLPPFLAWVHWEVTAWSFSQHRAGSPGVPEALQGGSSVCLLPLRIPLSLAAHYWIPSK